jgi:hypothetical protein
MLVEARSAEVGQIVPTTISQLAFGVRYEPQFAVTDRIGSLVDAVLRADGTPFGPETFPVSQASPTDHALLNPETDNVVRISHTDTILVWSINTRKLDEIHELGLDFENFLLRPVRQIAHLSNIVRYGFLVHVNDINESSLRNRPTTRYLSSEFPNATSLSMRFSHRLPSDEALVKKRVEDYRNAIYTVVEGEDRKVNISMDYQEYFKPPLDASEWNDRPFARFIERGLGHFQGRFHNWFETFVGMAEVA